MNDSYDYHSIKTLLFAVVKDYMELMAKGEGGCITVFHFTVKTKENVLLKERKCPLARKRLDFFI